VLKEISIFMSIYPLFNDGPMVTRVDMVVKGHSHNVICKEGNEVLFKLILDGMVNVHMLYGS
jgi:hypothetical protein